MNLIFLVSLLGVSPLDLGVLGVDAVPCLDLGGLNTLGLSCLFEPMFGLSMALGLNFKVYEEGGLSWEDGTLA